MGEGTHCHLSMIDIAAIALVFLIFSLTSRKLAKSVINAPIFFLISGIFIGSDLLTSAGVGDIAPILLFVGVTTLGLSFFNNAARTGFSALKGDISLPFRLLFLGLPLTVLAGTFLAVWLFPELKWIEAALLAVILTPSDTNLIGLVLNNPRVPQRIRQAINIESSLNDGFTTPMASILIILSQVQLRYNVVKYRLIEPFQQIAVAILVGIFVGALGGWFLRLAEEKKWIVPSFQGLVFPSLTMLVLSLSAYYGGNYFIASFVAGIFLTLFIKQISEKEISFSDTLMNLFNLLIFLFLGQIFFELKEEFTWQIFLYAFLSLTLVRILPISIAMWRKKLDISSLLFMGWFGPRGLASIVLATIVVAGVPDIPHGHTIILTVVVTVSMSVVLHGLTAIPFSQWYGDRMEKLPPSAPELYVEDDDFSTLVQSRFAEYQQKWKF